MQQSHALQCTLNIYADNICNYFAGEIIFSFVCKGKVQISNAVKRDICQSLIALSPFAINRRSSPLRWIFVFSLLFVRSHETVLHLCIVRLGSHCQGKAAWVSETYKVLILFSLGYFVNHVQNCIQSFVLRSWTMGKASEDCCQNHFMSIHCNIWVKFSLEDVLFWLDIFC